MENSAFDTSIFVIGSEGWVAISPYLALCAGLFLATLTAGFRASLGANKIVSVLTFSVFVALSGATLGQPEVQLFGTGLVINNFVKIVSAVIGTLALVGSLFVSDSNSSKMHSEWLAVLIVHVLGLALLPAAGDFISFFVYLETFALSGYVLAALDTGREKSLEAGLKYLMTGAFASGFFLMGVALIFGATGNLNFSEISEMLKSGIGEGQLTLSYVGILFVLSSLLFKVGSVPFHMWAPDVYQASPTAIVSVLATAGKVSVFAAMGLLFVKLELYNYELVREYLYWIGVLSVVIGSLAAIAQRTLRRVLAYSGIVNAGYVVLAISLGAPTMGAVIVNLLIYSLTFIATLAVIERVLIQNGSEPHGDIKMSELGLVFKKSNPFWAALFVGLIFSTAGLPPLPGFFGKYLLLKEVWTLGGYHHVFFILLGTLLGLMYYLNAIVLTLLKESPTDTTGSAVRFQWSKSFASIVAVVATAISLWALSGLSRLPAWISSVELFAR